MLTVGDVRERLCGSPFEEFSVNGESPKSYFEEIRDWATKLLDDLGTAEQHLTNKLPKDPNPFLMHVETVHELCQLIEHADLALTLLNASSPAAANKVICEWSDKKCSATRRQQLREAEQNALLRVGMAVGMLVSNLASRSRFFSLVVADESRTDGRSKGGTATRKVTPEVADLVRQIYSDEKRPNVSNDAAFKRTVARLCRDHKIVLSKGTVRGIILDHQTTKR